MFNTPALKSSATAYSIANSLIFNDNDSAYLTQTPSAGDQKTWTMSMWVKRGNLGDNPNIYSCYSSGTVRGYCRFLTTDTLQLLAYQGGAVALNVTTVRLFRDLSAWYHIVLVVDTTEVAANDRYKLYINGIEETNLTRATTPALNDDLSYSGAVAHFIGLQQLTVEPFDGYMAEINFIDGQALDASNFGEFDLVTDQWIPKVYAGTYGTNGFFLDFEDETSATTLGYDVSGNANHWTPSGIATTDQTTDTPTDNFCVWNALDNMFAGATFSEGNLKLSTANYTHNRGTIPMTSGKWYMEVTVDTSPSGDLSTIGIASTASTATTNDLGTNQYDYAYLGIDGAIKENGSDTAYGNSYTAGDIVGIAVDLDNNKLYVSKNNTFQNSADPAAGTGGHTIVAAASTGAGFYTFAIGENSSGSNGVYTCDFGQKGFTYTPPSGFVALSTANLSDPIMANPAEYFNPVIYTGDGVAIGSGGHAITGVGFQPDLVWVKDRDTAVSHLLFDSVRGATNYLSSDLTSAEGTLAETLASFDADGFTSGDQSNINANTKKYAAWNWLESVLAGFDIVSYTGDGGAGTFAHSLGVKPDVIIVKPRTGTINSDSWQFYHSALGATKFLNLDTTAAVVIANNRWDDTEPTSSIVSVGNSGSPINNESGEEYIAYLFASVEGYSKFDVYTGNGNADGMFINCGFRPAYLMIKRTDTTNNWNIMDIARNPTNLNDGFLKADSSNAEGTGARLDFLSNGFKLRNNGGAINASGGTYIYMAFAESPFKTANAR